MVAGSASALTTATMAGRFAKEAAKVPRVWHIVDARDQVVGRLATQVSRLLIGKHKPTYTPHIDNGDWVVVVNAKHAALTGRKFTDKLYHRHTGYPGGLKTLTARQLWERAPDRILSKAVKGMLPRNRMHKHRLKRLRIFPEEEHLHEANLAWAAKYAPEFLEQCVPDDVTIQRTSAGGDFVVETPEFDEDGNPADLGEDISAHPDFHPEDPDFDFDAFLKQLEEEEAAKAE